jgi:hypothetical protein
MFPRLLLSGSSNERSSSLGACRDVLANLYRAIARESGSSIIIDSSKDPVYAALLLTVPEVDVKLIHLVRDARGVAFSQRRLKTKPEIHWTTRLRRQRSVLGTAIRWDASALMWRMLAKRGGAMLLRYEDLARRPTETMEDLAGSLRGEMPHGLEVFRDGVRLGVAHSVSGASVRFHHGDLQVTLDDEWNRAMLPRERRMVTALTWPGLLRFGYPLRTSGAQTSSGDQ